MICSNIGRYIEMMIAATEAPTVSPVKVGRSYGHSHAFSCIRSNRVTLSDETVTLPSVTRSASGFVNPFALVRLPVGALLRTRVLAGSCRAVPELRRTGVRGGQEPTATATC